MVAVHGAWFAHHRRTPLRAHGRYDGPALGAPGGDHRVLAFSASVIAVNDHPVVGSSYADAVTEVTIRAYGSLNDFLPPQRRQIASPHVVGRRQWVKDLVDSLGVPHSEIA